MTAFIKAKIIIHVRGSPESLRTSAVAVLRRPRLTPGEAIKELASLITMGIIGPQDNRDQVEAFDHKKQNECNYHEWIIRVPSKGA